MQLVVSHKYASFLSASTFLVSLFLVSLIDNDFPRYWELSSFVFEVSWDELHLFFLPLISAVIMYSIITAKYALKIAHQRIGLVVASLCAILLYFLTLSLTLTLFILISNALGGAYDWVRSANNRN